MQDKQQSKKDSLLLLDRFIVQKKIFQSQKYETFLIKNVISGERYWMKVQVQETNSSSQKYVFHEAFFLGQMQGFKGIPFLIWSGEISSIKKALIIEKLGPSLHELMLKKPEKRFQMNEIALIGERITTILQVLHDKNNLLNQINVQTFRLGCGQSIDQMYLFDMFHCSKYQSNNTLVHKQPRKLSKSKKVVHFMSYNQITRYNSSRKDDMELMLYFLIYLSGGNLPWINSKNKVTEEQAVKLMFIFIESLKEGTFWQQQGNKSIELKKISDHIQLLKFKERPNYNFIRNSFKKMHSKIKQTQSKSLMPIYQSSCKRNSLYHRQQLNWTSFGDEQLLQQIYYPYEQQIAIDFPYTDSQMDKNHKQEVKQNKRQDEINITSKKSSKTKRQKDKQLKTSSNKCLLI